MPMPERPPLSPQDVWGAPLEAALDWVEEAIGTGGMGGAALQQGPTGVMIDPSAATYGAKGDGTTDDTAAIQAAINAASAAASSAEFAGAGRGIVRLRRGSYRVTNLVLKSNVRIEGAGFRATALIATASSGYVLGQTGLSTGTRMANVAIANLSIGPAAMAPGFSGTRPGCGGIDLSYSQWCYLENVFIHNLAGIGMNRTETFDLVTQGMHFLYVGTDSSKPALLMAGTATDTCNANHDFGMRIERCPVMIKVTSGGTSKRPFNNQFVGCKFEWHEHASYTIAAPAIQIEQAEQLTFSASSFATSVDTQPMIRAGTASGTATVGLKFDACDYIAPTSWHGWIFDGLARCLDPQFVGGHASKILKFITAVEGCKPSLIGVSGYDCMAPIVDAVGPQIIGGRWLDTIASAVNTYALRVSSLAQVRDVHVQGVDAPAEGLHRPSGISVGSQSRVEGVFFERVGVAALLTQTRATVRGCTYATVDARFSGTGNYLETNETDERVVIPASRLATVNGTPLLNNVARTQAWLLDAAIAEAVGAAVKLPERWQSYHVDVVWASLAGGTGDVVWRLDRAEFADGDTLANPPTGSTVTATAGTALSVRRTRLATGATATAGKHLTLAAFRIGSDAADTVSTDVGLVEIVLTRAS